MFNDDPCTEILCTNAIAGALLMGITPIICSFGIPFEIAMPGVIGVLMYINTCSHMRMVYRNFLNSIILTIKSKFEWHQILK